MQMFLAKSLEIVINNLKQDERFLFFGFQMEASNYKNMFNPLMWKLHSNLCN